LRSGGPSRRGGAPPNEDRICWTESAPMRQKNRTVY